MKADNKKTKAPPRKVDSKRGEVVSEPKKKRPLTTKQKKLVKGLIEGKTQKQAAKEAGLNEQYASDILKKPEVRATLQELMEHMGLSDGALLVKHKELLNAQKQLSGVREADSGSVEFVEVPDHPVQVKALEMAYRLKGAFTDKVEITDNRELADKLKAARERVNG